MPSKDELVQRYNRMNTIPQVTGQGTPWEDGDMAPTGAGDGAYRARPGRVMPAALPADPLHPVPLPPEPQPELHRAL